MDPTLPARLRRNRPRQPLGFGLPASRAVGEYLAVVLGCPVCGTLL